MEGIEEELIDIAELEAIELAMAQAEAAHAARPESLLAVGAGARLLLLDPATGEKRLERKAVRSAVVSVELSPDGRRLAVVGRGESSVVVWDVRTLENTASNAHLCLWGHDGQAGCTCRKNTGGWFASSSAGCAVVGHRHWVAAAAWSPCGLRIATGGKHDKEVLIWNAQAGTVERRVDAGSTGGDLSCVAFSPDGLLLAVGGSVVVLWHTGSWEQTRTFKHRFPATSLSFSSDSQKLACGMYGDDGIDVWDLQNGHGLCSIDCCQEQVAFTPDGSMLVTCGMNDSPAIYLWAVPRRLTHGPMVDGACEDDYADKPVLQLRGHTGRRPCTCKHGPDRGCPVQGHQSCFFACPVSYSPDGQRFASGGSKTVKIWDPASWRVVRTIELEDDVGAMAWGKDFAWERGQQALALAMGLHTRLGVGAPIRALGPELMAMVLERGVG